MFKFYLSILLVIFPLISSAQIVDLEGGTYNLKGIEKISINWRGGVSALSFVEDVSIEEIEKLNKSITEAYNNEFKSLFERLQIDVVNTHVVSQRPPKLYGNLELLPYNKNSFLAIFSIYIIERTKRRGKDTYINAITWVERKNHHISYDSHSDLESEITNKIHDLAEEFELTYYRANK